MSTLTQNAQHTAAPVPNPTRSLTPALVRGGIGGMIGGAAMAMFAMVAAVTYQHHGFFTPLLHISALFGSPDAMMRSATEAMSGNRFWFSAGPAALGLTIHMVTGAMYGIGFALLARRIPRKLIIPAGAAYGSVVFIASAFVGLPIASKVTGSGNTISDMASMVGWATFAIEHMMFGVTLAAVLAAFTRRGATADSETGSSHGARSAMLSR